jgi:uncharacterized protein (UPF0261 family)
MPKPVLLVGAMDTKGEDFAYVQQLIEQNGLKTLVVDFGVLGQAAGIYADIPRSEVAKAGGGNLKTMQAEQKKDYCMETMTKGLTKVVRKLYDEGKIGGILGMAGSGGTSIASAAMRALPVGFPKLMVSTVASEDVSAYVGTKDIMMVSSIVDVAGLNRISRLVYANAAGAISGAVKQARPKIDESRPFITASMFGNTTKAVDQAKKILEKEGYEVPVFHATGTGGKVMEGLIDDGLVNACFDFTTTELADYVCGGVMSAGPDRLMAAARKGIPTIIVPGCVDMANFWGVETMPAKYQSRKLYKWNPNVTLMRTNVEENIKIGELIAGAANAHTTKDVTILIPLKGVSMLDSVGGEFWDVEANHACFNTIKKLVKPGISVIEIDANINDPAFVDKTVEVLLNLIQHAAAAKKGELAAV